MSDKLLRFHKKHIISLFILAIVMSVSPLNSEASGNLDLNSEAFILIDAETNEILYERNAKKRMYPASITKILTAVIAIETLDLQEKVTVSDKAVRAIGTRVYLLEDEEVTVEQLLHGLMVSSGNDAAIAIAEHIDGSVEKFAERMTRFAKYRIGVEQSNFENPHGLFEADHYTTAKDMALISSYAMKNETFRELVGTEYVDWVGEGWETRLYNHHPLLRQNEEIIGIKNGFVRKSGYTLSTAAYVDDTELIAVTLNAPSRNMAQQDTLELLEYGFEHYETQWVSFEEEDPLIDYVLPEKVPVTTKIGEKVNAEISTDGMIQFFGKDDRLISKLVLDEREPIELPRFRTNIDLQAKVSTFEHHHHYKDPHWLEWLLITGFYLLNNVND
ncbi:D-alanyl-D-alanine carboxypeptidase [Bacillus shivajii]|uniref:D-alanyl-D-alanine carboxypeptidase family protein n=1 Tax=Bacillus shivajii TaxID=1983719 RepID=UPI001CF9A25F|nr:D-alanyl-D-alanine carboxypeptidase family protein [Bacillus shivajii]UCZ54903.1 D-alanyl-D-alanine carboxypeptidase [Bacillus shivajii]